MRTIGNVPREFLSCLTCFVVEHWGGSSSGDMIVVDRATADLNQAHVASSRLRRPTDDKDLPEAYPDLHVVVVDIDHEAHLVPSSTPGHYHLYVDIPPVRWDDYVAWLQASAKIGLVEQGYVDASIQRGHSDVRLPWVHKGDSGDFLPKRPILRCSGCKRPGQQIPEYRLAWMGQCADENESETREPTDSEVLEFIWQNEGTLNHQTGFFACTECYIKAGMPSSDSGWTAPVPQDDLVGDQGMRAPAVVDIF